MSLNPNRYPKLKQELSVQNSNLPEITVDQNKVSSSKFQNKTSSNFIFSHLNLNLNLCLRQFLS